MSDKHTPTHSHTHTHTRTYTHTLMQLHWISRGRSFNTYLIVYKHTRACAYTFAHIETPTNTHVCLHVRAWACTYMCTNTHTHTHTPTHPHLHTHHVNICMRTCKHYQLNETEVASHNASTTMCEETKITNHQSPTHTSAPLKSL